MKSKLKKRMNSLFSVIAQIKVYFANAGLCLSIANFVLILATFKLAYNIEISAYLIVPIGFLCIIFIGWLDYNLIFLKQTQHTNKRNDIKIQLNRIEEKLNKLYNTQNTYFKKEK